MRRKPSPPSPDLRQPWQIAQGASCGCRGTDDMCVCQNENPWPRPRCAACGVSVGEYHRSNCIVLWGGKPPTGHDAPFTLDALALPSTPPVDEEGNSSRNQPSPTPKSAGHITQHSDGEGA